MKKVLFLAIAALAYAGSVNAQALTYNTGSYPTANVVTTTSLVATGVQDAVNGNTTPLKMTIGGNYKFEATSSAWSTILGATWNSTIAGSIFEFVAAPAASDLVYAETTLNTGGATDGISDFIGTGAATKFDLTLTPTSTTTKFTFAEYPIVAGQTTLGVAHANSAGCVTPFTVNVTPVEKPTWATAGADVTIDKPVICTSQVANGFASISIKLGTPSSNFTTRYVKSTLSGGSTTTGAPLFTDKVFETTNTAATLSLDIFKEAVAASGIAITNFKAGVYTYTVTEVNDDVLNNADNVSTLANLADKSVVFTILPAPTPTLTTATK